MAEWTTLFDLGECTVAVYSVAGEETIYSGVLAKGQSAEFTDNTARAYTVSVSADGAVSLDGADDASSASYEVNVIPSYDHDYPARIRAVVLGANANAAAGQIEALASDWGVNVLAFDTLALVSPDPLDMTALTGTRTLVGMAFGNGGIG